VRFNIISNLHNGAGLQRDFETLQYALIARGHQVKGVQFNDKPLRIASADVNIFDEVVTPLAFKAAPVQWVMPHPEWWFDLWDRYHFDKVLAKTRDCERIFKAKVGGRCQYLGWAAKDLYRPGFSQVRRFLHISGKSRFKNTPAVIEGCRHAGVPLTVIGEYGGLHRVNENELIRLMNSHFCQVMPSAYEGYGHVIHESQSVGQVLITTDVPPMNEVLPSFCIPSISHTMHHAAPLHKVSPLDVSKAVEKVMGLTDMALQTLADEARAQYDKDRLAFEVALDELVGCR